MAKQVCYIGIVECSCCELVSGKRISDCVEGRSEAGRFNVHAQRRGALTHMQALRNVRDIKVVASGMNE